MEQNIPRVSGEANSNKLKRYVKGELRGNPASGVKPYNSTPGSALATTFLAAMSLNYPLALQAALEGQGLVMARRPFAAAELANGRLIQPFNMSVDEPASWIQVTKHKPEPGSAVYLFTEWLRREIDSDSNFNRTG